jgi:NhaP-type Na+/H+ or K+/H+ antiporter
MKYMKTEWLSLTTLLLPVMTAAWFISALLIWGLIPGLTYLEALVIGSCVTPTDPVLANSIWKGVFFFSIVAPLTLRCLCREIRSQVGPQHASC